MRLSVRLRAWLGIGTCLVGVVAVSAVRGAAPAGAQATDSAALSIEAVGGANGYFRPGLPVAVRVSVRATRLVKATLVVSAPNAIAEGLNVVRPGGPDPLPSKHELAVELQGATTREFVVVMPTPPNPSGTIEVIARDGDRELASATVQMQFREDEEYIGLLSDMAARLTQQSETVPLPGGTGAGRFSNVPSALLRAGPDALAAYDMIVTTGAELSTLSVPERESVLVWVGRGGRLLLDDDRGLVESLPGAWQIGPSGYRLADAGEIRLTRGKAAAGAWSQILGPTTTGERRDKVINDIGAITIRPSAVDTTLSQDAGFRLPSVNWFIALLGVYLVVIGPLAYWLFRRRGATMQLWVAVPIVALLFTGGVGALGGGLRGGTHSAHETLIETSPAGNVAYTHALVGARRGGEAGIALPDGWGGHTRLWANVQPSRRSDARAAAFTVRQEDSGVVNTARVIAGEFVQFDAAGPLRRNDVPPAALAVAASAAADGQITGRITNNLKVALERVAVFAYNDGTLIDRLEPGASADFTLSASTGFKGPSTADARVWPELDTLRPPASSGLRVNAALWAEYVTAQGPAARDNGRVIAAGWTDRLAAPVRALSGDEISFGRTAIVAQTAVSPSAPGAAPDTSIARQLVRGPSRTTVAAGGDRTIPLGYRFVLSDQATNIGALGLRVPSWVTAAEVFTGEAWQRLDLVSPRADGEVTLPGSARRDGEILVRVAARSDSVNAAANSSDLLVFGRRG